MLALKLGHSLSGLGGTAFDNYSLQFDGSNEYVDIDTVTDDLDYSKGTFSAWVKGASTSTSITILQTSADLNNFIRLLYKNGTTDIACTIKKGSTATSLTYSMPNFETDGLWHHVAITWDFAESEGAGLLRLYVDGTLRDNDAIAGTWSGSLADTMIAKNSISDASYWNGHIDEVSVFDDFLDATQAAALYNSGNPVNLTGRDDLADALVGYWRFEEGSGTVAADSSGKGNTGTLTNTPTWSTDTP